MSALITLPESEDRADIIKKDKPKCYSWTQISLFAKNPKEYENSYVYGIKFQNEWMELGSRIHKAIETGIDETFDFKPEIKVDTKPYTDAVKIVYSGDNDEPVESEQSIFFNIGRHKIVAKIDCITKNKNIDDYKITSNPKYVKSGSNYQLFLYYIALLSKKNIEGVPRYIFLVRDKEGKFIGSEVYNIKEKLTRENIIKAKLYIRKVLNKIDRCWETGVFE